MKQNAPNEFSATLKEIFQTNADICDDKLERDSSFKFRVELEKLE